MSDSRRHSSSSFTPYSILRPESDAAPPTKEEELADLPLTTAIEGSSGFPALESQDHTGSPAVQRDHLSAGLVPGEDQSDWIELQEVVPQVAAECLNELNDERLSPDSRLERFLFEEGKMVFQLIRDIAWSAAMHFGVQRSQLESWRGRVQGNMSEWRLAELRGVYRAIGDHANLITTDYKNAPSVSARQEFICRVHLLRILYRHAEGKDSDKFGKAIPKLCEGYRKNPGNLVQEVLRQAQALKTLDGCTREIKKADLQPEAFSELLRDLSNARKHARARSLDCEKLFFDEPFPRIGFSEGCWPMFVPAVMEWIRASRLNFLWPAKTERRDKIGWIMSVDRHFPTQSRVDQGSFQIEEGSKYVVRKESDRYQVMFPYLENLALPEEP